MEELTQVKSEVSQFLYDNQIVEIKTNEDYTSAGDVYKLVSQKIKKLEEKRKEWTQPILSAKAKIDADFKEATTPLNEFITSLKEKMLVWHTAEQIRLNAEQARLDQEALSKAKIEGKSEVEVAIVNNIKISRGDVSTTSTRQVWTFSITDESLIPRKFMMVNMVALREAVRGGERKISGLSIYPEDKLTIR